MPRDLLEACYLKQLEHGIWKISDMEWIRCHYWEKEGGSRVSPGGKGCFGVGRNLLKIWLWRWREDKECYIKASVPSSWSPLVKENDTFPWDQEDRALVQFTVWHFGEYWTTLWKRKAIENYIYYFTLNQSQVLEPGGDRRAMIFKRYSKEPQDMLQGFQQMYISNSQVVYT